MDTRVPPPAKCVLRDLLELQAQRLPDKTFIVFDEDEGALETRSYAETLRQTRRLAGKLGALGVGRGDRVLVWSTSARQSFESWFAINYLGAVYVPINIHYRGTLLARVVAQSEAKLLIASKSLLPMLDAIDAAQLQSIAIFGEGEVSESGVPLVRFDDVEPAPIGAFSLQPWDTQAIMFTSGTTGASKGVLSSYCHLASVVEQPYDFLNSEDRYLCNLPLFHVGGMLPIYAMLTRGGSVALSGPFKTAAFWDTVDRTGATACTWLSGMATLLAKHPESETDKQHSLRKALVIPLPAGSSEIADRFGVSISTIYHMTEICAPLFAHGDPGRPGECGTARPGVDLRLADLNDRPVAPGEVGELLVRTDRPWAMSDGYLDNPAATAAAWRNGWFHTGDSFRLEPGGQYVFVDRLKDVIRRRGENISSWEVESEVCKHPSVLDAAALAVPDENGEDEVLLIVEPRAGTDVKAPELLAFLEPLLPRFMLPRYIHSMPQMPRTPTGKVQKVELRRDLSAIAPKMWDARARS